jgi:ribosomal protein S18 acetylase RimI-like enzyme
MQIRSIQLSDLDLLDEIDATIQSDSYLHVDRAAEALSASFRIENRPLPERRSESNPISDDLRFQFKQIASGIEDGFCVVAELDDLPVAAAVAVQNGDVVELIDLRVDFDRRREGFGSAMMFQVINFARERESRAIRAFVRTGNGPFNRMLAKLGFEIAGIDTQRLSNHDLVKEQTTLIWYLQLI